ncbi:uncharacterized protein LOC142232968 [Haematobia irritans]|uniref:uncharacterized protein LOC142232968 n=1 Tax=Haematobia irritans TaxID=7368 RepID=UPI003F4FA300
MPKDYDGSSLIQNFGKIFKKNPREVTRNPYLNFLRDFKWNHQHYNLQEICHYGSMAWRKLKRSEKKKFLQKNVLKGYIFNGLPSRISPVRLPTRNLPVHMPPKRSISTLRRQRNHDDENENDI